MIRLAVFGQPVSHSLSPRIHAAFAAQCGLDVDYQAIEATPETFPQRVADFADRDARGCNVTVPFKHAAWRLAAQSSEAASLAEAANTLIFSATGWFADNTDGGGLVNDLTRNADCRTGGRRLCLLGAGGAAAGVLGALLGTGPSEVVIANRTAARAVDLAGRHAHLGPVTGRGLEDMAELAPFDILINATSLGHQGGLLPVTTDWIAPGGLCYDMNYGAAARPLRALCEKTGIRFRDGLGMLVEQAALSFCLWTGKTPDASVVLAELRSAARE